MRLDPGTRRRLLDFELWLDAASCDEVIEADWGRAYLTPSLPLVWDATWLAVEEPGLGAPELGALADEVLGERGFPHRTVVPLDEDHGRRALAEAGDLPGWEAERVDYMVWRQESGRRPAAAVREVGLAEIPALRGQLIREFLPPTEADPPATAEQLLALDARFGGVAGDRWFVAPAQAPAAACRLLAGGGVGQVEDVGTLAPARNRGSPRRSSWRRSQSRAPPPTRSPSSPPTARTGRG